MPRLVYVELAENGMPSRIFRNLKAYAKSEVFVVVKWPRSEAVRLIRWQVYKRDNGSCVTCGKFLPWDGSIYERAHMHEIVPRSKGGEVSLSNCQILCFEHHINAVHGKRKPQFSKAN